jgi:hypothetical protein
MGDPRPGLGLPMRGDSMKMPPNPQLLACCPDPFLSTLPKSEVGLSEDLGLPPP